MPTRLLAGAALVLAVLILYSRSRQEPPVLAVPEAQPTQPAAAPTATPRRARVELYPVAPGTQLGTPAIDLRARLAVRRRIEREGERIYLDSLLARTDSVVIRWADSRRAELRFRIEPDTALTYWTAGIVEGVRAGMAAWSGNTAGIRMVEARDSLPVDITVRFTASLGPAEFGATDLSWDNQGEVTGATIQIAIRPDPAAKAALPPSVIRRVAAHEIGHALGLPHSGDRRDMMYFNSAMEAPSRRDQATLMLLYAIPTGSLKEP